MVVLAGDFRQTLPVVKQASPAQTLDVAITRSKLWRHFRQRIRSEAHSAGGASSYNGFAARAACAAPACTCNFVPDCRHFANLKLNLLDLGVAGQLSAIEPFRLMTLLLSFFVPSRPFLSTFVFRWRRIGARFTDVLTSKTSKSWKGGWSEGS